MANSRTIRQTTAADGTQIELRELPDGRYQVTDGAGNRFEDPVSSLELAEQQYNETERLVSRGARAEQSNRSEPSGLGGGFDEFGLGGDSGGGGGLLGDPDGGDGLFGGFAGSDDSDSGDSGVQMKRDEQGRFKGRADDECDDNSGGLFGGFL